MINSKMMILILAIALSTALVLTIAYFVLTYENREVTQGEAYGFKIGASKREVYFGAYGNIMRHIQDSGFIFTNREVNGELAKLIGTRAGSTLFIQTRFDKEGFDIIEPSDTWTFYFDASFLNGIRLMFVSGELTQIYRFRMAFELP